MRPHPTALDEPLPEGERPPMRVGWLVSAVNIHAASVRYRCFHMARVLGQSGIESAYYSSIKGLLPEIATLDALVIVKRIDVDVLRAVAAAARLGIPIYLDLCDDLLSDRYGKNPDRVNGLLFTAIAPHLSAVTAPSAAMAERVRDHMARLSLPLPPPVRVIPDIAETRTLYHLTEHFLDQGDQPPPAPKPAPHADPKPGHAQVLWFGNFGAPHSNFGIFSLLPVLPALAAVHRDLPLELVVVSNNQPLFDSLTEGARIPARYIPWSPSAVYDALEQADVVLNTSGTDAFCTVKSSNRPLQALASGVPVISDPSPALAEFEGIVMTGQYEANLRRCLGMDPGARHEHLVAPALPILERYTPQALAGLWRQMLQAPRPQPRSGAAPVSAPKAQAPQRVMIYVTPEAEAPALGAALKSARKAGLDREVLMPVAAAAQPHLRNVVGAAGVIPRVFSAAAELPASLLEGTDVLVIAGGEDAASADLSAAARQTGLPVARLENGPPLWSALLAAQPAPPAAPPPPPQPGPNPEQTRADGTAEWLFVVHQNNRGWILDAISREIGSRQLTDWAVAYNPRPLPRASTYFFTHYSLFQGALRRDPEQMARARSLIWYTHPRSDSPAEAAELLDAFKTAHRVIFACSEHRDLWLRRGLPPEKGVLVLGGADPGLFTGHTRGGGVIGLSSSFYERKNPDTLRALVQRLPHRRFHLIGRHWERYALFEALRAAPNFRYDADLPYARYPEVYKTFDVFLSMSKLEGGPIPLLEAMTENAVPVASRTGFAPDLISHGKNGYLFDTEAPASEIAELIEAAFSTTADIRASVQGYDWDSFARRIVELAQ